LSINFKRIASRAFARFPEAPDRICWVLFIGRLAPNFPPRFLFGAQEAPPNFLSVSETIAASDPATGITPRVIPASP